MDNYYDILGIKLYSNDDEIRSAFRQLAKIFHPDMPQGNREKYDSIRIAYEVLSELHLRKAYDQDLKFRLAEKKKEKERPRIQQLDIITKIEIILAYSTTRKSFRPHFANSCLNQLAEGRELTQRQIDSIDNVICSFQINLDYWMDDKIRQEAMEEFFKNKQSS